MRKYVIFGGAGVVVLGIVAGVVELSGRSTVPVNPSARVLAQSGIMIKPLTSGVPVGLSIAKRKTHAAFSKLPSTTPMAGELVVFYNKNVFALQHPQPAWLVTWNETSSPQGPASTGQKIPQYTHMNAMVSAKTGALLEIFPSP